MAVQWTTFPMEFKGWLISNLTPLQQGTNAVGSATILQNIESDREGGYSKLKGYSKFSTTAVPGTGEVLAMKVVSSGRVVVARKVNAAAVAAYGTLASGDLNKTAYYHGTGTSWAHIGTGSSTNTLKTRFADFNFTQEDKTIFVDSKSFPIIYNSSGNTTVSLTSSNSSDVQGAENVVVFKNHAFYSKGSKIFFTAPNTVDDFATGNGAGTINI